MLAVFGDFLLAIRKSVGNEETRLDKIQMLEWLITDIHTLSVPESADTSR